MLFDIYARYYDLLYRDKDYAAEAEYVASNIRRESPQATRILELGCGTGAHAEQLARLGFFVHGIDLSETMLASAEVRKAALPVELAQRLSFRRGDVRTVRTAESYDAVISLFHVLSYQSTESDQEAMFETASTHLIRGGPFVFDFWFGPGVLAQKPELRVKRLEDADIKVTRIAEPVMNEDSSLVDVNYTVFIETKSTGRIQEVRETHRMRYFSLADITRLAVPGKWASFRTQGWMEAGPLCEDHWAGCAVSVRS